MALEQTYRDRVLLVTAYAETENRQPVGMSLSDQGRSPLWPLATLEDRQYTEEAILKDCDYRL